MLVLLVDPDADALAARLGEATAATLTPVTSVLGARAYLGGAAFDAVAVRQGHGAAELRTLVESLGLAAVVIEYDAEESLVGWLGGNGMPLAEGAPSSAFIPDVLEDVEARLSDLAHTLHNPLAVIAGNAQLGRELARATGASPDIAAAFTDVEAGVEALRARLAELGALRAYVHRVRQESGGHA